MGQSVTTYTQSADPWVPQGEQLKGMYGAAKNWYDTGNPLWSQPTPYQQLSMQHSRDLAGLLPELMKKGTASIFNIQNLAQGGTDKNLTAMQDLVAGKMKGAFDNTAMPQLQMDYGSGPNVNPAIAQAQPRIQQDITDRKATMAHDVRGAAMPLASQLNALIPQLMGLQTAAGELEQNAANTEWDFLNKQAREPYDRLLAAIQLVTGGGGSGTVAGKATGPNTTAQGVAGVLAGLAGLSNIFGANTSPGMNTAYGWNDLLNEQFAWPAYGSYAGLSGLG